MGVRRERPPDERSGGAFTLRLPDGTVKTMGADDRRDPVAAGVCCFCGGPLESDSDRIRLSAGWVTAGEARTQSWDAHHGCLAERIHDAISGNGPFFRD